nr:hypothetical protein [Nocardia seriolae]
MTQVPGNTFSFYDHILDNALLFGAVPQRFEPYREGLDPLDFYFLMARGRPDLPPLELVKLLNTPYHYRQPELETDTEFSLHPEALLDEFDRAKARGIELRPVILGPLSLLLLSKTGHVPGETEFDKLVLLDKLLPVYEELFEILAKRGATCVQLDEPCFTSDRSPSTMELFEKTYQRLSKAPLRPRMLVTGQYGDFGEATEILCRTAVEAIGLDLASHRVVPEDLAEIPGIKRKRLYAGVIRHQCVACRPVRDAGVPQQAGPGLPRHGGGDRRHAAARALRRARRIRARGPRRRPPRLRQTEGAGSGFAGQGAHRGPLGEVAQEAHLGALQAEARGAPARLRRHPADAGARTLRDAKRSRSRPSFGCRWCPPPRWARSRRPRRPGRPATTWTRAGCPRTTTAS